MLEETLIDAAATYRLTKFVTEDYITQPLREKVFETFGDPQDSKLSYLITCDWCISIWAGAGVAIARSIVPKAWRPLAYTLAYSAAAGWIREHE